MIPCAVFVVSLDMKSMLVLVLYDSFGGKMVNASLRHAKKLVPNFLCVWYVALCPTTLLCVLILHLVWMCAGMGESTSDKSSLHMDLYTKVWFQ